MATERNTLDYVTYNEYKLNIFMLPLLFTVTSLLCTFNGRVTETYRCSVFRISSMVLY
jgi:hypothetical protein